MLRVLATLIATYLLVGVGWGIFVTWKAKRYLEHRSTDSRGILAREPASSYEAIGHMIETVIRKEPVMCRMLGDRMLLVVTFITIMAVWGLFLLPDSKKVA